VAVAIRTIDARRPQAANARTGAVYQPHLYGDALDNASLPTNRTSNSAGLTIGQLACSFPTRAQFEPTTAELLCSEEPMKSQPFFHDGIRFLLDCTLTESSARSEV
jgi:hypothetical protein